MSVVKFPGQAKRRPFAVAAFDPKREKMLLRAERIVELLSSRAIRDGWSFDKNRAARFLHCLRTFDRNDPTGPEVTEISELGFRSRAVVAMDFHRQYCRDDLLGRADEVFE